MKDLVRALSDGRFHSGTALGERLGLTRAAVWKKISELRQVGLIVHSVKGKGYRLDRPFELLREDAIREHIRVAARSRVGGLEIVWELGSTNGRLMENLSRFPTGQVCLAERQSAGRGRRGHTWVSPLGSNIYLSMLWRFDKGAAALSGLSLALGVAVLKTLEELGAVGVELKWPNDVLWQGRKLAGILVEVAGESEGPCSVVLGVGVNQGMPPNAAAAIDRPWADVSEVVSVGRNRLAGVLVSQLVETLEVFDEKGLGAFAEVWESNHAYKGQPGRLQYPAGMIEGVVVGVDPTGALLMDVAGEVRSFTSGEISLRPVGKPG